MQLSSNPRVIEVVAAIHKKVREQAASYETPMVLEDWAQDLTNLNAAYDAVYSARNLVGTPPQLPGTFIGIVAGWMTKIVQRMLFWYTPQIRHFQGAATTTLNRVCSLEERKYRSFLAMADRMERLEREVRLLRAATPAPLPIGSTSPEETSKRSLDLPYTRSNIDTSHFYAELQRRLQSSAPSDETKLGMYLSVIASLDPAAPAGKWLDLGCGEGKWLRLVRDRGFDAVGVDTGRDVIDRCRESGFEIAECDVLEFLRSAGDQSFAVVSAFHLLEHCPFDYCLNLVYQVARVLKPDGVLLVETPHPGNLLVAAEQFWIDPSRQRPIPSPLMAFLFDYCGLDLMNRFEVNPRPEEDHLPFPEVELCNRLNLLLYGPQDYALLGRRHA